MSKNETTCITISDNKIVQIANQKIVLKMVLQQTKSNNLYANLVKIDLLISIPTKHITHGLIKE